MMDARPDTQDVATSMWRYGMSLWRALDRERLEFFDPFRLAAQIGVCAARHHPPSGQAAFQLMQYNACLLNKAWWANQEALGSYLGDEGEKCFSAQHHPGPAG